jgi:hypothetical protein
MHGDSLVAVRLPDKSLFGSADIGPISTDTVRRFSDVSAQKKREPEQIGRAGPCLSDTLSVLGWSLK